MAFDLSDEELQATREMNGASKKVMSEEERMIKYVEKIVEDSINNIEGKDYFEYIMTMNDIQAIQGLLDLYNKEKEKNKILSIQIIENEKLYDKETARLGNLIQELLEGDK